MPCVNFVGGGRVIVGAFGDGVDGRLMGTESRDGFGISAGGEGFLPPGQSFAASTVLLGITSRIFGPCICTLNCF